MLAGIVFASGLAGATTGDARSAGPAGAHAQSAGCSDRDPAGELYSSRRVEPEMIRLCDTATVVTHLRADCGTPPLSVMLNVDRSGSMYGAAIRDVVLAGHAMVDSLDPATRPATRMGLISHGEPAEIDVPLGRDVAAIRAGLDRLTVADLDVPDNLPGAIDLAREQLVEDRSAGAPRAVEAMVVLSDGGQTFSGPAVIQAAERAKGENILIIPVCVENRLAQCAIMEAIASRPDLDFRVEGTADLARLFDRIASRLDEITTREMRLEERLPEGLSLVPDSASPPLSGLGDGDKRLRWTLGYVPAEGITVTYRVRPAWVQRFELPAPEASVRDPKDSLVSLSVPAASLVISGTCGLETPTPSPSPTTVPSATPTATVTPSPTATREPRELYLPLLFLRQCVSRPRPADIVLLMDASSSMMEETRAGRSKLAAVQDGAQRFVAGMRPEDRSAVLAFNNSVALMSGLSADRTALQAAIAAIQPAPGTRIDVALYAAAAELAGERRRPDSRAVIVLMTDGEPSADTRDAVLLAAEAARAAGGTIFAIGVGEDVDAALLTAVAGDPERFFAASDAEAVPEIYRRLAESIPCR